MYLPNRASLLDQPPASAGDSDSFPGWEDLPEKEMATPSNVFLPEKSVNRRSLAEEPGRKVHGFSESEMTWRLNSRALPDTVPREYSLVVCGALCCCSVAAVWPTPHDPQTAAPQAPRPWVLQAGTLEALPLPSPVCKSESEGAQSCPTLRDPMDCSLPGSSVHGIFQARALEWVPSLWNNSR